MVRSLGVLCWALCYLLATAVGHQPNPNLPHRAATPPVCNVFTSVVSPWWLHQCKDHVDLAMIDLRSAGEYAASHIPGSVSVPFEPVSEWSVMGPDDLLLEMPPSATVFETLGSIGVWAETKIVLVYSVAQPSFPQAAAPRVATTLKYAGIPSSRIAVLDGGFPGWDAESLATTTEVPAVVPKTYRGVPDSSFLVDRDYVATHVNKQDEGFYLVDARDTEVYNGSVTEPWAPKAPGHIPSAQSLPAPRIWNSDGTFKSEEELFALVRAVVGLNAGKNHGQIILYCGVGGYASSWHFVLTSLLKFHNVVMYDGSAQDWVRHFDMER